MATIQQDVRVSLKIGSTAALDRLNSKLDRLRRQTGGVNRELTALGRNDGVTRLNRHLDVINRKIVRADRGVRTLGRSAETMGRRAERGFSRAVTPLERLNRQLSNMRRGLQSATRAQRDLNRAQGGIGGTNTRAIDRQTAAIRRQTAALRAQARAQRAASLNPNLTGDRRRNPTRIRDNNTDSGFVAPVQHGGPRQTRNQALNTRRDPVVRESMSAAAARELRQAANTQNRAATALLSVATKLASLTGSPAAPGVAVGVTPGASQSALAVGQMAGRMERAMRGFGSRIEQQFARAQMLAPSLGLKQAHRGDSALAEAQRHYDRMMAAVDARDFKGFRAAARELTGAGTPFSAPAVKQMISDLTGAKVSQIGNEKDRRLRLDKFGREAIYGTRSRPERRRKQRQEESESPLTRRALPGAFASIARRKPNLMSPFLSGAMTAIGGSLGMVGGSMTGMPRTGFLGGSAAGASVLPSLLSGAAIVDAIKRASRVGNIARQVFPDREKRRAEVADLADRARADRDRVREQRRINNLMSDYQADRAATARQTPPMAGVAGIKERLKRGQAPRADVHPGFNESPRGRGERRAADKGARMSRHSVTNFGRIDRVAGRLNRSAVKLDHAARALLLAARAFERPSKTPAKPTPDRTPTPQRTPSFMIPFRSPRATRMAHLFRESVKRDPSGAALSRHVRRLDSVVTPAGLRNVVARANNKKTVAEFNDAFPVPANVTGQRATRTRINAGIGALIAARKPAVRDDSQSPIRQRWTNTRLRQLGEAARELRKAKPDVTQSGIFTHLADRFDATPDAIAAAMRRNPAMVKVDASELASASQRKARTLKTEQLVRAVRETNSLSKVAKRYGIAKETVRQRLLNEGHQDVIPGRTPARDPQIVNAVARDLANGIGPALIARNHNLTKGAVAGIARDLRSGKLKGDASEAPFRRFFGDRREVMSAYDANGRLLSRRFGERDIVRNLANPRVANAASFHHNHPDGGAFSPADVRNIMRNPSALHEITTPSGSRFTAQATQKFRNLSEAQIAEMVDRQQQRFDRRMRQLMTLSFSRNTAQHGAAVSAMRKLQADGVIALTESIRGAEKAALRRLKSQPSIIERGRFVRDYIAAEMGGAARRREAVERRREAYNAGLTTKGPEELQERLAQRQRRQADPTFTTDDRALNRARERDVRAAQAHQQGMMSGALGTGAMASFMSRSRTGLGLRQIGAYGGLFGSAGLASLGVRSFADFQAGEIEARAIGQTNKINRLQSALLSRQARELGASTMFRPTDVLQSQITATKAGRSFADIRSATPQALNLAAVAGMSTNDAMGTVLNFMAQGGIKAKDTGKLVDQLTTVFLGSKADLRELSVAGRYAVPTLTNFGVGMKDQLAMLGALSEGGLAGSIGGRGLRQAMLGLSRMNPTRKALAKQFGFDVDDHIQGGKVKDIRALLANLFDADKQAGGRLLPAIMPANAFSALTTLREMEHVVDRLRGRLGGDLASAAEIAATKFRGLTGAYRQFKSQMQETAISIGEAGPGQALERFTRFATRQSKAAADYFKGIRDTFTGSKVGDDALAFGASTVSTAALLRLAMGSGAKLAPGGVGLGVGLASLLDPNAGVGAIGGAALGGTSAALTLRSLLGTAALATPYGRIASLGLTGASAAYGYFTGRKFDQSDLDKKREELAALEKEQAGPPSANVADYERHMARVRRNLERDRRLTPEGRRERLQRAEAEARETFQIKDTPDNSRKIAKLKADIAKLEKAATDNARITTALKQIADKEKDIKAAIAENMTDVAQRLTKERDQLIRDFDQNERAREAKIRKPDLMRAQRDVFRGRRDQINRAQQRGDAPQILEAMRRTLKIDREIAELEAKKREAQAKGQSSREYILQGEIDAAKAERETAQATQDRIRAATSVKDGKKSADELVREFFEKRAAKDRAKPSKIDTRAGIAAQREAIKEEQRRLKAKGIYKGDIDGVEGRLTRAARKINQILDRESALKGAERNATGDTTPGATDKTSTTKMTPKQVVKAMTVTASSVTIGGITLPGRNPDRDQNPLRNPLRPRTPERGDHAANMLRSDRRDQDGPTYRGAQEVGMHRDSQRAANMQKQAELSQAVEVTKVAFYDAATGITTGAQTLAGAMSGQAGGITTNGQAIVAALASVAHQIAAIRMPQPGAAGPARGNGTVQTATSPVSTPTATTTTA